MSDSSGSKLETAARFAQWKIENLASCSFRRSDPFKVGLWNWHLTVEKGRYLYVRIFPELCRVSKESPPFATFVLRLFNVGSNRKSWTSPVYDRLLRTGEDFVWTVDSCLHGRLIIDVEFLDLKIASIQGGETKSIWPTGAIVMQAQGGVSSCLSRMLEEEILTDVTIDTKTGSIGAHRAVLAARSPVFEKLFTHERQEKSSLVIHMEDFSLDACRALLRFVYGSIKIEEFLLHRVALLQAADKYDIRALKEVCEESLLEDMDAKNVLERLQDAWRYGLDKLRRGCLRYLLDFGKIYDVRDDLNGFLQTADRDLILEMFQGSLDILRAF